METAFPELFEQHVRNPDYRHQGEGGGDRRERVGERAGGRSGAAAEARCDPGVGGDCGRRAPRLAQVALSEECFLLATPQLSLSFSDW